MLTLAAAISVALGLALLGAHPAGAAAPAGPDAPIAAPAVGSGALTASEMVRAAALGPPVSSTGRVASSPGASSADRGGSRARGSASLSRTRRAAAPRTYELTGETRHPYRSHGRVFFRLPSTPQLRSCSGTLVRSARGNVVLTAGHCVYDHGASAFNRNVVFVPAYREGEAPLGQFPAETLLTPKGWAQHGDTNYDIGLIQLAENAQDLLRGRPLAFNQPLERLGRLAIHGYPALPEHKYDGERPIVCEALFRRTMSTGRPAALGAHPCDMQQGSSGGGWINPAGYLISVVSHGFCDSTPDLCGFVVGPYFGSAALRLYRRAGGSEPVSLRFLRVPERPMAQPAFRLRARASTPVRFSCRVDRGPVRPCRAAMRLRRLDRGRHVLRVRALDQVGRKALIARPFRVLRG